MTHEFVAPVDLSKYIDTKFFGERPHIRGRRIPVATIVNGARVYGWDAKRLMDEFDLSESQVLAALLYYNNDRPGNALSG